MFNGKFYRTINKGGYSKIIEKNIDNIDITIYPNPVINSFNLIISSPFENENLFYWISNYEGKIMTPIFNYKNIKAEIVDLTGFVSGSYFVSVLTKKGIVTKKIVKY